MEKGDCVKINYIGRIKGTGEIFDLTYEDIAKKEGIYNPKIKYGPVSIIVGSGMVLKGLDDEIKKMKVGEKKKITLKAKDAFGERDPRLVKTVPESELKKNGFVPRPGLIVDFSGIKGRIQSVSSGRVRIDFNNPLAGKDVEYEIEVIEKIDDKNQKIKHTLEFFGIYEKDYGISINGNEIHHKKAIPENIKKAVWRILSESGIADDVKFVHEFQKGAQ